MILTYLIKSTLCLGILFGSYKIVLENKAMHHFKRYYLLASLLFAFSIPLVTFTYTTDAIQEPVPVVASYEYYSSPDALEHPIMKTETGSLLPMILWSLYSIGVLVFSLRFLINLVRLKRKINSSEQFPKEAFTLSLVSRSIIPHSFLKWIFLNKKAYLNQEIAPEVLAHEATHVRQKHSLDILFVEVLQILFWFNPFIWLSKISIKLNHEFLADQGALTSECNIAIYQNILLSYAGSTHHTALESPFNYSLTKKRILMMSQTFSRKRAALSALVLLPILGVCTFLFNNEIKAQPNELNENYSFEYETILNLTMSEGGNFFYGGNEITKQQLDSLFSKNQYTGARVVVKGSVSEDFIKEKTSIISQLGLRSSKSFCINFEGDEIISEQRRKIEPRYPSYQDLVRWQNQSLFLLYLDEEKIENTTILQYNVEDLPYYAIGDRTNGKYRVDIWTNPFWQNKTGIGFSSELPQETENYAQQFSKGAVANGKKPLVIEIRNNEITINGTLSTLETFSKDIDAITRDWTEKDFKDPARTYMFKGNSEDFLKKLETEYAKTHISRATGGAGLIPPPPQTPQSLEDLPAPPPPPSVEDHLFKMNRLGGEFYYNDTKITYAKAQKLIEAYEDLNVKTPYPYSTPPKTFITKEIIEKVNTQNPATKKEIAIYNKLAIKYNKDPEGIIKQGEVIRMYDIYSRMTPKQKKNSQPYPVLPQPPPPPPPPPSSKKSEGQAATNKREVKKGKDFFKPGEEFKYPNKVSYTPKVLTGLDEPPYDGRIVDKITVKNGDAASIVKIKTPSNRNKLGLTNYTFSNDVPIKNYVDGKEVTRDEVNALIENRKVAALKAEKFNDSIHMFYASTQLGIGEIAIDNLRNVKVSSEKDTPSLKKKNPFAITTEIIEDVDETEYYILLIDKCLAEGGVLKLGSQIITREEALKAITYPYIVLQQNLQTAPKELIIIKDPMTSHNDYYYQAKLLSEKEYFALILDETLTTRMVRSRKNEKKGEYHFVKK